MTAHRYRSRPQVVEAIQWDGATDRLLELTHWAPMYVRGYADHANHGAWGLEVLAGVGGAQGWVPVPVGHWVARPPDDPDDHWPIDPDYFAAKYQRADEAPSSAEDRVAELERRLAVARAAYNPDHPDWDALEAAIGLGSIPDGPTVAVSALVDHLVEHTDAAIIHDAGVDGDETIATLLEAGWTWDDRPTELVAGKRIRYLRPPSSTAEEAPDGA